MGINIQSKTDYSALFSSLNTSTSNNSSVSDLSSLLTDYSSIKSGTYGKLLKAYYAKGGDTTDSSSSTSSTRNDAETSTYNKVSATADSLQKSIDSLSSVDTSKDEETLKAVQNYVKDYNSFLDAADASKSAGSSTISGRADTIKSNTASYSNQLAKLGITVGNDGKLALDEDTFNAADKTDLSKLFAEKSSYGYSIKVSAAMAASNASYEASKTSLYTSSGTYNMSTGTLMDSIT